MKLLVVLLTVLCMCIATQVPELGRDLARREMQEYSSSLVIFIQQLGIFISLLILSFLGPVFAGVELGHFFKLFYAVSAFYLISLIPKLYLKRRSCTRHIGSVGELMVFALMEVLLSALILRDGLLNFRPNLFNFMEYTLRGGDLRLFQTEPIPREARDLFAGVFISKDKRQE